MILAAFAAAVGFAGECEFSGEILLEQTRGEADPPTSFDLAVEFNRDLWDAIFASARWTGGSLSFDDAEIILGRGIEIVFEEGMDPGQQATLKFRLIGDRWAIPSEDFVPPPPDTCPTEPTAGSRKSPRSYGNKPVTFDLLLGKSPRKMQSWRLFQGQSLQKSNQGQVAIVGEISCADDGIIYADKPLCYQLPPFSGKRRGEIVKDVAALSGLEVGGSGVGFDTHHGPTQVIVPIGNVVSKPILLSNASLVAFVNDLGQAENWFASFDEQGRLFVRVIDRKDLPALPDWTLDEALGDFDYDSIEESPPTKPATRIFVTVAEPVRGTGPGGSDPEILTRTTEEEAELYAPQCVKVRPSGAASYLFGDASYRTIAAEELMVTNRKITEVTTRSGLEIRRRVQLFRFYNPRAYDPNFDTDPPTNLYDGAYGNRTFHRDEAESLMEVSEDLTDTTRDLNGSTLATLQSVRGWYAPHRANLYVVASRTKVLNDAGETPPAYVYAGGTTRVVPVEEYQVDLKVEKAYIYGEDSLVTTVERRYEFYSPDSRCDLIATHTIPDSGPPIDNSDPDAPPPENPPPVEPPEPPPNWHPLISGPIARDGDKFTFRLSIAGAPANVLSTATGAGVSISFTGFPAPYGSGGTALGHSAVFEGCTLIRGTQEEGYASVHINGPKPVFTSVWAHFSVNWSGDQTSHRHSNNLLFDPWADVPAGGSL